MKDISIIMPVYNGEKTIINTIESILKQNYNSYELIIINDHSTDKTENICKQYQSQNPDKVKFYNNLKNKKGVSSARNYGISKSNANYIMFIDSDDFYEESMISEMISNITENDLIVCGYKKNDNGQFANIHNLPEMQIAENMEQIKNIIEILQREDLFNVVWNKIFKNKIIKENNIMFPEHISLGEDYRFVLDYIEKCRRITVINKVLYIYNRVENGLALKYNKNNLAMRLENLKYHIDIYHKNTLDTSYLDKKYVLTIFSGYAETIKNNNKKAAKSIIKQYMDNETIKTTLKDIYIKNNSLKLRLLICLLNSLDANIIYCIVKIAIILRKMLKKVIN